MGGCLSSGAKDSGGTSAGSAPPSAPPAESQQSQPTKGAGGAAGNSGTHSSRTEPPAAAAGAPAAPTADGNGAHASPGAAPPAGAVAAAAAATPTPAAATPVAAGTPTPAQPSAPPPTSPPATAATSPADLALAPSASLTLTLPSPGASAGPSLTASQAGPEDASARTLATGGTLLTPPPMPREGEPPSGPGAPPTPTPSAAVTVPSTAVAGSEAGSCVPTATTVVGGGESGQLLMTGAGGNGAGGGGGGGGAGGGVQPGGFQCMPASSVAKEVAQLSWVGHGGYGAVYKGVWQGANVAVKFTVADYMDFAGASAHEAVLSKMLSHPNVVQTFASRVALLDEDFLRSVFDGDTNFPSRELPVDSFRSGEGFGSPYGVNTSMKFKDVLTHIGARPGHYITQMIMEYCDRGSLHQAIAKGLFKSSSKWNNKIALRALLRTAREIAQGMSHLHACRVVHGDLKPGNVLLMSSRADRRGFTAKVSDFGLSTYCMASHTSVTRWSTVSYMAPEAFEGHLTMGSDTFSFGVLLWEMYTGQQPYAGLQAAQIVMGVQAGQLTLEWPPDSDPRIQELVEGCIQRNPAARPTFLQLINQLTSLEAHIRLEAPATEGTSEARMPLLVASGGVAGSGAAGSLASAPAGGAGGGGGAARLAALGLTPAVSTLTNATSLGAADSLTSPPTASSSMTGAPPLPAGTMPAAPPPMLVPPPMPSGEEASFQMLTPPPLPPGEDLSVSMLTPPPIPPEEEGVPFRMLTPPPLPPEEEAQLLAAARLGDVRVQV